MPVIRSLMVILFFTFIGVVFSILLTGVVWFLLPEPPEQASPLFNENPVEHTRRLLGGSPLMTPATDRSLLICEGCFLAIVCAIGASAGIWVAARKRFYRHEQLDWYEVSQEVSRIIGAVLGGWVGTVTLAVTLLCVLAAAALTPFELTSPLKELRLLCWLLGGWPVVYWMLVLRAPSHERGRSDHRLDDLFDDPLDE